jgi:UDP-N-acetylmuramoyl-tripeptide--D-alanyl-D-alanine ligase
MTPQTLTTLAEWSNARILSGDAAAMASSVCTDTRRIQPGCLFVALSGANFDAHDFAAEALAAGAAAVLVSRPVEVPAGSNVLLAGDTIAALQSLAAHYRTAWAGLVIGLTGSTGKTSTKDMINAVLSRSFKVRATLGNLNNHIGLPLTVLSAEADDSHGVFEMGMNHPGEIAPLAAIAGPDVGVITNVGTAHIEYMGSREAIALEKGMLAEAVHPDGLVILNANDPFTPSIAARCRARVISAGKDTGDVRVTDIRTSGSGCTFYLHLPDNSTSQVQLPVPGRHMAGNAALAAAVGYHFGLRAEQIVEGLESTALTYGRIQVRTVDGLLFIDDTYNANPDSMRAALDTLQSFTCTGRRIAVLGLMGELGPTSAQEHRDLGAIVYQSGADQLCVVGSGDAALISEGYLAAGGTDATHHAFPDHASCAAWLRAEAGATDIILVKGSRSAAMERVIHPPTP